MGNENRDYGERFARQRDDLLRHFHGSFSLVKNTPHCPAEASQGYIMRFLRGAKEYIADMGLFQMTEEEKAGIDKNLDFAEGASVDITERARDDAIRDVLEQERRMIEDARKARVAV